MPPRPARKVSDSPLSSCKYPSPNAKELPSRRQMIKRAPSRVKSHGSMLTNKSCSSSSDKEVLYRCESERWGSSAELHTSSKHLPQKPTRRSSVVQGPSCQLENPISKSPSSHGQKSVHSKDGSACRILIAQCRGNPTAVRSQKTQRNHSEEIRNSGQRKTSEEHVGKLRGSPATIPQSDKHSGSDHVNDSNPCTIHKQSPKRALIKNPSDAKTSDTKASDRSIASNSAGSGLSLTRSLGNDVQQIRRWANTA
jgi:hypothetical protein